MTPTSPTPPPTPTPQRDDRRHAPVEPDRGDRTEFQRDRDAILYTSALRRLAGVTQVIATGEGEVVHNRLTHTLEVAQIALRLAERLLNNPNPGVVAKDRADLIRECGGLDVSVVEGAALAHDLGHPPFGHVAEHELNEMLVEQGVIEGFEGNAQSFRIVTKLAVRRGFHPVPENDLGLNLTRATLNAILKYPWLQRPAPLGPPNRQAERKWGVYQSEEADLRFAREGMTVGPRARSLEAEIMDWADDIAYSVHDTEDFYRVGLIPLEQFALSGSPTNDAIEDFLRAAFTRRAERNIHFRGLDRTTAEPLLTAQFRAVCGTMPFTSRYDGGRDQRAELRQFTSRLIGQYVSNTKIRATRKPDESFLDIPTDLAAQVEMLKELTWQFVIKGPSLAAQQNGYRLIIRKLFEIYSDAVMTSRPSRWDILPMRNREEIYSLYRTHGTALQMEDRLRVAVDAIAGLTDEQATLVHHRLMGLASGSVFDPIVR